MLALLLAMVATDAPAPATVRVMSLNVAHGAGPSASASRVLASFYKDALDRVAEVLSREAPDIVGLQEVDAPALMTGNFNHQVYLAERAGYPHGAQGVHFEVRFLGPKVRVGTGLISRLPLSDKQTRRFDTGLTSLQGFVQARFTWPNTDRQVEVFSLHLDPALPESRRLQAELLVEILRARTHPVILLGDYNCTWVEGCMLPLVEGLALRPFSPEAKLPSFPAGEPTRRIDWILISEELEFVDYRHLTDVVSDHLAVVATLRLR